MTLESTVKKALAIGAISTALIFNPVSPMQEAYAQSSSSASSSWNANALKWDKEQTKIYTDMYDSLAKQYGPEIGRAVFESANDLGIDLAKSNADHVLKNPELKKYPFALAYTLIKAPTSDIQNLTDYILGIDALLKEADSKYNREMATKELCDIIEIMSQGTEVPIGYNLDELIETYLNYDFSPMNNVDIILALKIRASKYEEVNAFAQYLLKDKKYSPDIAGAVLIANEKREYKKEIIVDFADSIIGKGYDDTLARGMITAFGYGSHARGSIFHDGFYDNRAEDIRYITSLLLGKYDSKTISSILKAFGKASVYDFYARPK